MSKMDIHLVLFVNLKKNVFNVTILSNTIIVNFKKLVSNAYIKNERKEKEPGIHVFVKYKDIKMNLDKNEIYI